MVVSIMYQDPYLYLRLYLSLTTAHESVRVLMR